MAQTIDDAVNDFVWREASAIPGRHPERVADAAMRAEVLRIVAELDAIVPGDDAADLFPWAEREARRIAPRHPGLGDRAITALRDLLRWTWR